MKRKILIVDDEPSIVRLLTIRLEANGYETFVANDGIQGFRMAIDVKPDLILLDLKMPAGGGAWTFEKLKATGYTSTIPIIIISALPGEEVKKLTMEMGADGFFSKPFKSVELLKKIEELIGE